MRINPYRQRHKYRLMTLVSGDIRFMRIFVEGPWEGGVKRQWGCRQRQFSAFSLAISSEALEIRPALLQRDTSSAFQWSQNAWPWMTLNGYFALNSVFTPVWRASTMWASKNNCVKTNKDSHMLPAAKIFGRDSRFWQYEVCANIRSGYRERRR